MKAQLGQDEAEESAPKPRKLVKSIHPQALDEDHRDGMGLADLSAELRLTNEQLQAEVRQQRLEIQKLEAQLAASQDSMKSVVASVRKSNVGGAESKPFLDAAISLV